MNSKCIKTIFLPKILSTTHSGLKSKILGFKKFLIGISAILTKSFKNLCFELKIAKNITTQKFSIIIRLPWNSRGFLEPLRSLREFPAFSNKFSKQ